MPNKNRGTSLKFVIHTTDPSHGGSCMQEDKGLELCATKLDSNSERDINIGDETKYTHLISSASRARLTTNSHQHESHFWYLS